MDHDLAQRIVSAVNDLSPPFNALDALSSKIPDAQEAREFRRALGEMMGLTVLLLRPAIKRFPELDPDKDAES
jgi:hypothetical protein